MKKILAAGLVAFMSMNANATLYDRGNGMIFDSTQNITWLADANYAKTSGYDADGRMTWNNAMTWANNLVYGGKDDWRLANANPSDTNCSGNYTPSGYSTQYYGYNCKGSELGHLFYNEFNLTAGQSILSNPTDAEFQMFSNIQSSYYWSGTESAPGTGIAWYFGTVGGFQDHGVNYLELYAWAVRAGDVGAQTSTGTVPVPGVLALFGLGLLGLGVARRRG